jgi:hypothetical protein
METLSDLLRASEIEHAARNDMVYVPRTTVVFPRHGRSELALKIFEKILEGAAQQFHAFCRFNSCVIDDSAKSRPESAGDAIVQSFTSLFAFLPFALPNSITVLVMPAAVVSANFLGIAFAPGVNDVSLLSVVFALLVENALAIPAVVIVLFLSLKLNIPGTSLSA